MCRKPGKKRSKERQQNNAKATKGRQGKRRKWWKSNQKKQDKEKAKKVKPPSTILDSAESSGIRDLPLQPNSGINTELLDLQDYIFQDMSSSKALASQQKLADFKRLQADLQEQQQSQQTEKKPQLQQPVSRFALENPQQQLKQQQLQQQHQQPQQQKKQQQQTQFLQKNL